MAMKLSIVIPCYNEEDVIPEIYNRLYHILQNLIQNKLITDYEIIFVDDGSTDNTLNTLKMISKTNKNVKIISFSRNFGHQAALTAGIWHASGDAIVTLDADLQDPPEIIKDMLSEYFKGYDIIYAARKSRKNDSIFKRWTASLFYRFLRAMNIEIIYNHADYRLISKKVANEFKKLKETNRFIRGLFPYLGFKYKVVYYDRQPRHSGKSKYSLIKMISFAWDAITSFSYLPLRVSSILGIIISFFSFLLTIWAFSIKLSGKALPGWASIVLPIYFLGGIQLFFLGLIGEYIGKTYMEVKKRPLFVIKEKINF